MKRYTALTIPSIRKINKLPKTLVGASLFAGGGGASTGMKLAGINVRYANEFIPGAIATYRANASKTTFLDERDIRVVKPSEILKHCRVAKGELDYLDASPPCKLYSGAAKFSRVGKRSDAPVVYSENVKQRVDDLFDEFLRILKGVKPKVFVTENVPGLAEGVSKGFFLEIIQRMKDCGYAVEARRIDPSLLGVPQRRVRIVFVGVRTDVSRAVCGPVFPKPSKKVLALRDVIPDAAFVQEGARGWGDARRPAPTIVAGGHSFNEYSQLSAGGYYKDDDGDVIKFTIPQLIKIFGYPEDYMLTGDFKMQWERLGRSHVPLAVYAIASTIREQILEPYNKLRKRKK